MVRLYGEDKNEHFNIITDDPKYQQSIIERIEASIVPLKNYSSIVSWSMGNESGFGINMVRGLDRAKRLIVQGLYIMKEHIIEIAISIMIYPC